MKLSISNIAWTDQEDSYVVPRLPAHGVEALEIAPTRVFPQTPYQQLDRARAFARTLKEETGLTVCSMQSIWYRRTESIFGTKEEVNSLIDYTKEAILFAEAINCPNLVFGSPKNRNIPEGRKGEDAAEFFSAIGDFAYEHGTVIALEAVPASYGTNFVNTTDDLYDYVRMVGSKGLLMNVDFGTMLTNGEDVSAVAKYFPYIHHTHISENGLAGVVARPEHDLFLRALKDAGYDRCVSIEMRNQEDPEKVLSIVDYVKGLMMKL